MSDTPRDKDARAAMDTILCSVLSGDTDTMTPGDVAHDAWGYADAMDAERRKREAAEAPAPDHHACHAEIAAAMREGRDAGLREARGQCEHGLPVYSALAKDADRLTERLRAMADENAKLRAVAEAAARWAHDAGWNTAARTALRAAPIVVVDALDAALPGWRSAP